MNHPSQPAATFQVDTASSVSEEPAFANQPQQQNVEFPQSDGENRRELAKGKFCLTVQWNVENGGEMKWPCWGRNFKWISEYY
jgi:hypothetical protein